ncbi:putative G-protein coupled receptor tkr-1 [Trichoplax sp. H2]|nr:putative G-protein coupled receptor tkr-1 [Trichoplax sp. H2]|eukprot:RDD38192.1 putative G-protein coupled receptor tkr-1 [Trichoplax sp. H2]
MGNFSYRNSTINNFYNIYTYIGVTLFSVIGFISNAFIFVVIFKKKRSQQPLNCLIANLALSDMVHSVVIVLKFVFPAITSSSSSKSFNISLSLTNGICNVITFIGVTVFSNSMSTLAAISIERCRAVVNPLRLSYNQKRMSFIFIFIWITALIAAMIFIISLEYVEIGFMDCTGTFSVMGSVSFSITLIMFGVIVFVIPISIIGVSYLTIIVILCRKNIPVDESEYKLKIKKAEQSKAKSIAILLIVTLLVAFSSIPSGALYIWISLQKAYDQSILVKLPTIFWIFFQSSTILVLIPTIFNPILYCYASASFKKEIKAVFRNFKVHLSNYSVTHQSRKCESTKNCKIPSL